MNTATPTLEDGLRNQLESYYGLLGMLDSILRNLPEGHPEAFNLNAVIEGGIPESKGQ